VPTNAIEQADPEVWQAIAAERRRQQTGLEMIASENYTSPAVLAAQGSVLTNKYAEGYPGRRYYGGTGEVIDKIETLAIERAKALFGAEYVNVQPHAGSQANAAVYMAVCELGDRVMGMDLSAGGHLTHGSPANFSGKLYEIHSYGVDRETERMLHRTIQRVTEDLDALRFNTAIAAMMELTNHLTPLPSRPRRVLETFVLLLGPFAPHLAEELWRALGHAETLAYEPWPAFDAALTRAEDRLYVGGWVGAKKPDRGCWYERIEAGLRASSDDGVVRRIGETRGRAVARAFDFTAQLGDEGWLGDGYELTNPGNIEIPEQAELPLELAARLEPWVHQPAPDEPESGLGSTSGPFWLVNSALVASTGDERAPLFAVRGLAPLRHLPHAAGKRVGESARSVRPPGRALPRKSCRFGRRGGRITVRFAASALSLSLYHI